MIARRRVGGDGHQDAGDRLGRNSHGRPVGMRFPQGDDRLVAHAGQARHDAVAVDQLDQGRPRCEPLAACPGNRAARRRRRQRGGSQGSLARGAISHARQIDRSGPTLPTPAVGQSWAVARSRLDRRRRWRQAAAKQSEQCSKLRQRHAAIRRSRHARRRRMRRSDSGTRGRSSLEDREDSCWAFAG